MHHDGYRVRGGGEDVSKRPLDRRGICSNNPSVKPVCGVIQGLMRTAKMTQPCAGSGRRLTIEPPLQLWEGRGMATGTVKWFNDAKGYGFITPDDGGEDLFAHFSAIQMNGFKTLKEGQKVQFEVVQGPKGKQASNITAPA